MALFTTGSRARLGSGNIFGATNNENLAPVLTPTAALTPAEQAKVQSTLAPAVQQAAANPLIAPGTPGYTQDCSLCPTPVQAQSALSKWSWLLAGVAGLAVGTGITVAAIGSRQKKRAT